MELLADSTRETHLYYFNEFTDWLGVSGEELYQWQRRLMDDGDPRSNRDIVRRFLEWGRLRMDVDDWSGGTVLRASYALKSFFTANALVFPIRPRDIPNYTVTGARVVMLDEIRTLFERIAGQFHTRNRALIMVLKDTGLRRSDISRLNCEDYLGARVYEERGEVYRVIAEYVTQKTGELAWVHLGPEACNAVDEYLKDRDSGPLFLNRNGERMYEGVLTATIIRCARRHLDNPDHVSPHSFRKTHRTLLEAHIPESYVKKLQGKSTDPYIHPEQTGELTEAYIRHYDAIRVYRSKQQVEKLKAEVRETQSDYDTLRRKVEALEAENRARRIADEARRLANNG